MTPLVSRILYVVSSAVAVLATIIVLHPTLTAHWATHYIGGSEGDGGLYVWLFHSFYFNPLQALAFETNSLYPYPLTRAWSDSFLLPSALMHLVALTGLSLPASYNAVTVAALTLNGLCVQALARAVAVPRLWAFAGGLLFANSSFIFGNLGHPQLAYFFWIPLSWSMVLGAAPRAWRWCIAGLCVSAAFYSAVYYAYFSLIGLGLIAFLRLITATAPVRRLVVCCIGAGIALTPICLSLPAYFAIQGAFGERHLYEASAFSASGLSYLAFSSFNQLLGSTSTWSHPEATLSAGYLISASALAFACLQSLRRDPLITWLNAVALIATLVCSSLHGFGPIPLQVAGVSAWSLIFLAFLLASRLQTLGSMLYALVCVFLALSLGPGGSQVLDEPMWAPLATLYGVVPGLDAIRAVGRYGAVVIMGIMISATWAISALRPVSMRYLCGALLVAATLLENSVENFPFDPPPPAPLAFESLARHAAAREAAIALPFASLNESKQVSWTKLAIFNTKHSLWAAPHGALLVNGYSGQRSRLQYDLSEALLDFPSTASIAALSRVCGLRWVVVVPSLYEAWNESSFLSAVAQHSRTLAIRERLSDGSFLLELSPESAVGPAHPTTMLAPAESMAVALTARSSAAEDSCPIDVHVLGPQGTPLGQPLVHALIPPKNTPLKVPNPGSRLSGRPTVFELSSGSTCGVSLRCSIP